MRNPGVVAESKAKGSGGGKNAKDAKNAKVANPVPGTQREGAIAFTRHTNDGARANQKSMVEEHRRKLQLAKEEVAASKLAILLPDVREGLLREALSRSDWVVDKALVLLEGFLSVNEEELRVLERRIDERKRAVLEANNVDPGFLDRERKERKKHRSRREKKSEKRREKRRTEKKKDDTKERKRKERHGEERVVFDDEAERRREMEAQREREKGARMAEVYRELQGGKAAEMREQALLKERLQNAYRTGDTEEVERLKGRLNPNKE
jgi:hypothetical protein